MQDIEADPYSEMTGWRLQAIVGNIAAVLGNCSYPFAVRVDNVLGEPHHC